jgi:hypothetical protein
MHNLKQGRRDKYDYTQCILFLSTGHAHVIYNMHIYYSTGNNLMHHVKFYPSQIIHQRTKLTTSIEGWLKLSKTPSAHRILFKNLKQVLSLG